MENILIIGQLWHRNVLLLKKNTWILEVSWIVVRREKKKKKQISLFYIEFPHRPKEKIYVNMWLK